MLTHKNVHFVLYHEAETGRVRAYITETGDMKEIRNEMIELGEPISAHPFVLEGIDAISQRGMFDLLSSLADLTEPNANPTFLLAKVFECGVRVGEGRGRVVMVDRNDNGNDF